MTDKGWICLAVALFLTILVLSMIGLWRISSNLTRISKRLDVTNDKLQYIYYAQKETGCNVSRAIKGVYETIFAGAEVTIRRNGIEEDEDGDI